MDNYKATFYLKIQYVLQMVSMFGKFNVSKDFFNITKVRSEGEKSKLGQTHSYGTIYEMVRLDKMFEKDLKQYLDSTNTIMKEDKKGIYFFNEKFLKK